MDKIDFVIPLRKKNMIIRTTIECIIDNYHPRNIYVITNPIDIKYLETECKKWDISSTNIIYIDEDTFFIKLYNLTRSEIEQLYTFIDDNSREFGWWYQQLLKLGSYKQIENLSDPYIVWDSDLIVLQKWDIFDLNNNTYKFAILQECAKNEFNKIEYSKSITQLLGLDAIEPEFIGTFVPHHFVFHHKILDNFLNFVEEKHINDLNIIDELHSYSWIKIIMSLSKKYYRFSEYKCVATFMNKYFHDLLLFYPYNDYGKNGIRYRDSNEIIEKIKNYCDIIDNCNLSFENFKLFVKDTYNFEPSYIQIEHVVK
jgi:hypothetical protein